MSSEETSVVDMEKVREERSERQKAQSAAQDEARRQHFAVDHDFQLRVLQHVMASGRLPFSYFTDLVRLGLITDNPDRLPCQVHERSMHHGEWVGYEWRGDVDDPEGDLIDGLVAELEERGVPMTGQLEKLARIREREVPPPNKVYCPLMHYSQDSVPPPCSHALQNRFISEYDPVKRDMVHEQILPDPNDVVLRAGLRPCLFLGREMFRAVLPGVWKLEEEWRSKDGE